MQGYLALLIGVTVGMVFDMDKSLRLSLSYVDVYYHLNANVEILEFGE